MSASGNAFAIAAHLHVLLRRKTGRVTDTEWMATNADYAREIVRHAREKAVSDGHVELLPWADKLEHAISQMDRTATGKPLLQAASASFKALNSAFNGPIKEGDDSAGRYVGGLR